MDGGGKVAHALLDALALKRERQLSALTSQRLRDGPGNTASVRDTEDQSAATLEQRHWRKGKPAEAPNVLATILAVATLVSVNTNAQDEFQKLPRPEARLVTDFGLEGDRHAGRAERQVSILDAETVAELAGKGMPVAPGILGENITVEGIPVMQLLHGTRMRIGEAELEVTGDRPACRELLEVHPDALRALVGRTGKMARVVRGGTVRPGDPIELIGDQVLGQRSV
jgi:MOSC domain-containing protein YiiM